MGSHYTRFVELLEIGLLSWVQDRFVTLAGIAGSLSAMRSAWFGRAGCEDFAFCPKILLSWAMPGNLPPPSAGGGRLRQTLV